MAVTLPEADDTISMAVLRLAVGDLLIEVGELRAHSVDLVFVLQVQHAQAGLRLDQIPLQPKGATLEIFQLILPAHPVLLLGLFLVEGADAICDEARIAREILGQPADELVLHGDLHIHLLDLSCQVIDFMAEFRILLMRDLRLPIDLKQEHRTLRRQRAENLLLGIAVGRRGVRVQRIEPGSARDTVAVMDIQRFHPSGSRGCYLDKAC